jgi:NADPH-dependent curcumin reductase CurA
VNTRNTPRASLTRPYPVTPLRAVGSVVVQIAKNVIGCKKVIGIAGGQKKCDWVKSIGADDCVDYKSDDYAQRLKDLLPDYANVYFDNVGGEILDVMLPLVARYGTIAVCGAIASE